MFTYICVTIKKNKMINKPTYCLNIMYPYQEDKIINLEDYEKLLVEYSHVLGQNFIKYELRKAVIIPNAPMPLYYCSINIFIHSIDKYAEAMDDPKMYTIMEKIISLGGDIRPIKQFEEVL